jgi:phosphate butyryltransferase
MEQIRHFEQLIKEAKTRPLQTVAIAGAHDVKVLQASAEAHKQKLAKSILIGNQKTIESLAKEQGITLSKMELIHSDNSMEACVKVMELINTGEAQIGMRGKINVDDFYHAASDPEKGITKKKHASHVSVAEIPSFDRLIFVTDAGAISAPTTDEKVSIVKNAIQVAHKLGIPEPKVAILAATEMVNWKIPLSIEAASIAKMADRGQIKGGIIDGPLALDNAISPQSVKIKGIKSNVAGCADILVVPDIEAGNILLKTITYFADGEYAGIISGYRVPLVVVSRADDQYVEMISIALAVVVSTDPEEES